MKPKTEKPEGKKRKQKPQNLLRQKRLALLLSEDGGKTPIGKLMLQAGYSKAYAKNPHHLKTTVTWQDLMEKNFPDEHITKRIRDLLDKQEFIAIGKKGERETIPTGEIDAYSVAKGVDIALKLKNKYPAEKHKVEGVIEVVEIVKYSEPIKNSSKPDENTSKQHGNK